MRSPRRATRLAIIGAGVAVTAGCLPAGVTDQGRDVTGLYDLFMLAAAGVFVVVVGLLAWAVIRYRGQPGREVELPPQTHGNLRLEVVWWTLPTLLVGVLVVLTAIALGRVDARADEPSVTVEVTGFQWGWRFAYPEHDVTVTGTAADPATIHLPVGETVAFEIVSQDVIHSFYIPAFLIKRDALPHRENRFDVLITEEGTYTGQCAEFCGLLHARQLFSIEAVQRDAFEAWLEEQAAGGETAEGAP